MSCMGNKLTQIVRRDKSMTITTYKLEEVYTNLWGLYKPPSQSGSIYSIILICKYSRKMETLYLQGKDDFVDVFQAWLPRYEAKSGCFIKTLRVDSGGEFISIKL